MSSRRGVRIHEAVDNGPQQTSAGIKSFAKRAKMEDVVDANPGLQTTQLMAASATTVLCACCFGDKPVPAAAVAQFVESNFHESEYRYRMDNGNRGIFIVISNENFNPETKMSRRTGTKVDEAYLKQDFERLGFRVHIHQNLTTSQMLSAMLNAAADVNKNAYDCFGVAVLSHGDNDVIYGTDGFMSINNFVAPIKSCKGLVGKPKLFIFQACRGNKMDDGYVMSDGGNDPVHRPPPRIPQEADCLYAYSTVPCYYSWRNQSEGSWFIQGLHRMMNRYFTSKEIDFVKLLTRVNHEVAYKFQSMSSQEFMSKKKQMPSLVSMLTKDLIFPVQ